MLEVKCTDGKIALFLAYQVTMNCFQMKKIYLCENNVFNIVWRIIVD